MIMIFLQYFRFLGGRESNGCWPHFVKYSNVSHIISQVMQCEHYVDTVVYLVFNGSQSISSSFNMLGALLTCIIVTVHLHHALKKGILFLMHLYVSPKHFHLRDRVFIRRFGDQSCYRPSGNRRTRILYNVCHILSACKIPKNNHMRLLFSESEKYFD